MKNMTDKHFDLVWARGHAGLTQENLAQLLGVSRNTVIRWETKKSPIPTDTWDTIMELLNYHPTDLPATRLVPAKPKPTGAPQTWKDRPPGSLLEELLLALVAGSEGHIGRVVGVDQALCGLLTSGMLPFDDTTLEMAETLVVEALTRLYQQRRLSLVPNPRGVAQAETLGESPLRYQTYTVNRRGWERAMRLLNQPTTDADFDAYCGSLV